MSTSGEVRSKALALLARRDFSRKELAQRLLRNEAKAQRHPRAGSAGADKTGRGTRATKTGGVGEQSEHQSWADAQVPGASDIVDVDGNGGAAVNGNAAGNVDEDAVAFSRAIHARTIEATLDALQAQGLQSDERFVESFLRSRTHRGQGPLRIRHELAQRGVDAELIDQHLTFPTAYWVERVAEVRTRRFGAALPSDPSERNRQARFLAQRGFPSDVIFAVLRRV